MARSWHDVRRTNIGGYVIHGMNVAGHRDDTYVMALAGQVRRGMTLTVGSPSPVSFEYRDRDGDWRPIPSLHTGD